MVDSSWPDCADTEPAPHQVAYFAAIITSDGFIVALDLRDLVEAYVCTHVSVCVCVCVCKGGRDLWHNCEHLWVGPTFCQLTW